MMKQILSWGCAALLLSTFGCCYWTNSGPAKDKTAPDQAKTEAAPTAKLSSHGTLLLAEAANGQTFAVKVGQRIRVKLEENPTTGYMWTTKNSNPAIVKTLSDVFVPPNTKLMGAPGYRRTMFQAVVPGTVTLEYSYARPWETGVAPVKTWKVILLVGK